jgi:hypothetical protein
MNCMRALVVLVAVLALAQGASAMAYWTNPYFRMASFHPLQSFRGDAFRMNVTGAGDRPLYAATVRVYYNGQPYLTAETDLGGAVDFIPVYDGRYDYTVQQGRYFSIGGQFDVLNKTKTA